MLRIIILKLKKYGIVSNKKGNFLRVIIAAFVIYAAANVLISNVEKINFIEPAVISVPVAQIDMEPIEVAALSENEK